MEKEIKIFKVKDKKLPKHDQQVLVKKKGMTPFYAFFQCWMGDMFWYCISMNAIGEPIACKIKLEISDKWMPILSKYFE